MWVCLVVFILGILEVKCEEGYQHIYVNTTGGIDNGTCNIYHPCKTLEYSFEVAEYYNKSKRLNIMVGGGDPVTISTRLSLVWSSNLFLIGDDILGHLFQVNIKNKGVLSIISYSHTATIKNMKFVDETTSPSIIIITNTSSVCEFHLEHSGIKSDWIQNSNFYLSNNLGRMITSKKIFGSTFYSKSGNENPKEVFSEKKIDFEDSNFQTPMKFTDPNYDLSFKKCEFFLYNPNSPLLQLSSTGTFEFDGGNCQVYADEKNLKFMDISKGATVTIHDKFNIYTLSKYKGTIDFIFRSSGKSTSLHLTDNVVIHDNSITGSIFEIYDNSLFKIFQNCEVKNNQGSSIFKITNPDSFEIDGITFDNQHLIDEFITCDSVNDDVDIVFMNSDIEGYINGVNCTSRCLINQESCDSFYQKHCHHKDNPKKKEKKKKKKSSGEFIDWRYFGIPGMVVLVICCFCCYLYFALLVLMGYLTIFSNLPDSRRKSYSTINDDDDFIDFKSSMYD